MIAYKLFVSLSDMFGYRQVFCVCMAPSGAWVVGDYASKHFTTLSKANKKAIIKAVLNMHSTNIERAV